MNYNLITILGPTATGKTKLAAQLAYRFNGEIISADSRQVYIGMDIGTGKDYTDYKIEDSAVPCHLIDITSPGNEFNVYEFNLHFKNAFKKIISKKKTPLLTGGTGLYISSIVQGYLIKKAEFNKEETNRLAQLSYDELKTVLLNIKPKQHNKTDLETKERIIKAILVEKSNEESVLKDLKIKSLVIGVRMERSEIRERITSRLEKRLEEGMIEEVQNLLDSGLSYERLLSFGLEYKFIALYLKGEIDYEEMFTKLNTAIHAFAKRQMTWFRKMEREGVEINWIEKGDVEKAAELITLHNFIPQLQV